MSQSITVPRLLTGAIDKLDVIGGLITTSKWERAAIVAAFVRLEPTPGFDTPSQFSSRGVVGLSKSYTVTKYVRAWLDTVGSYPRPGSRVPLPDAAFPSMRTGTDGYSTETGTRQTIERIAEDPDLAAVAAAALVSAVPETVAAAVEDNAASRLAGSRTRMDRASSPEARRRAREERDARAQRMAAARGGALNSLEQSGLVDHQATIEAHTARAWLRRAVAAYERNPVLTAQQRVDTDAVLAEIEHLVFLLRVGSSHWTGTDRAFLDELGIDEEVAR